jgi:hypothetical protein
MVPLTATHSLRDAHAMPINAPASGMATLFQAFLPAEGALDTITWPAPSTAAQNDADGQEIP